MLQTISFRTIAILRPTYRDPSLSDPFARLQKAATGLKVSHIWRGYGSALFLELGTLTPTTLRDGRPGQPQGEVGVMIEFGWRIEDATAILVGSWSEEQEWQALFDRLVGGKVVGLTAVGRIPELSVDLAGDLHVVSFNSSKGDPNWALFDRRRADDELTVHVRNGRIVDEREVPGALDRPVFGPSREIGRLLDIMAELRMADPWDKAQTFKTIAPYTIEEAYEVADAIERGNMADLKDELGDLLLQVVFHARIGWETLGRSEGQFDFGDVVEAITTKLIRRHPQIFGPDAMSLYQRRQAERAGAKSQDRDWERIKAEERAAKAVASDRPPSILDDVAAGLPSLMRAVKLQKRAAKVGFDWPDGRQVIAKIREELDELEAELEEAPSGGTPSPAAVSAELGDVLFALANLARHLEVDPDAALRATNQKFIRRFQHVERTLGGRLDEASLEEMEALWQAAKAAERTAEGN
jgi:ATP diphosphatase